MRYRRCRVVGSLGEIELSHVAERPLQAVGILLIDGDSRAEPPVEVGRHCHVTQLGKPPADALDVAIDSEYLLDHDQPGPRSNIGQRHIAKEAASITGSDLLGTIRVHDLIIFQDCQHKGEPFYRCGVGIPLASMQV